MNHTENINWEFITRSINQQKCVLFIGPGVTINYQKPDREAVFLKQIAQQYHNEILSYHEEDGFLIFKDENTKLLYLDKIRPFYEQDFSNTILDKISDIPFHLIISITPDLSLNRVFDTKRYGYIHGYYKGKVKQKLEFQPSSLKPLIYNLLGCIKADESLITSHYDLFNLIQSIYADKNLPDEITSVFNRDITQNIIFLGFDFNKWYFQLILHLLRINYESCVRYAATQDLMCKHLQTLCESHFKVTFVSDNPGDFINTLHAKFSPEQLRKAPATSAIARRYKKENILKFIGKTFNATDFETFCLIHFEEVYQNFTPGQAQTTRLNALIEYSQKYDLFEDLLQLGREENPIQFSNFEPYYEET